jgi:hypothetical protein
MRPLMLCGALAIAAMLLGSLSAEAQVIHLSCEGNVTGSPYEKPEPVAIELTVDLDKSVVHLAPYRARIREIDTRWIEFSEDYDRGFTHMSGSINRINGIALVKVLLTDTDAKTTRFEWAVTCRRIHPLF